MILIWNANHQWLERTNFLLLTPGKYLCYQLAWTIMVLMYRKDVLRNTILTIGIFAKRYVKNPTVTGLFWSKKRVTHMWDKVFQRKTLSNWQEDITLAKARGFLLVVGHFRSFLACCRSFLACCRSLQVVVGCFKLFLACCRLFCNLVSTPNVLVTEFTNDCMGPLP